MNVKERLIKYLDHKGLSKSAFSRSIGVSNAYITSIRRSIQPDKIEKISLSYPDLNMEWLLTGRGEMIRKDYIDIPSNIYISSKIIPNQKLTMVSLISKYAYAEYADALEEGEEREIKLPEIDFFADVQEVNNGHVAVEIRGDLMDNGSSASLLDGDIVLCRILDKAQWDKYIEKARRYVFLVVACKNVFVCHLSPEDGYPDTLKITGLNPLYPEARLHRSEIIQLGIAVRMQRRNF